MYHSISETIKSGIHPYYETATSPKVFAEQMKYLHENRYSVLSLQEMLKVLESGKNLPEKAVIITFDDGFYDFYAQAFPIMENYGFSATVFLPAAYIDNQRLRFENKEFLSWTDVRELQQKGIIFGSHTTTHEKLHLMHDREVEYEIRQSKKQIEDNVGKPIEFFSYPHAFPEEDKAFLRNLKEKLKISGFNCCVTTSIGSVTRNDKPFFLKRLPINSFDDPPLFEAKLSGAYDWLHGFQYFRKLLKNFGNRQRRKLD